jgi:hypothetical protein
MPTPFPWSRLTLSLGSSSEKRLPDPSPGPLSIRKHPQVVYESQLGVADDKALQDAMLQRLAEKDPAYYGGIASTGMVHQKAVAPGSVRSLKFLDTETCYWQLALQQQRQYRGTSDSGIPYLGMHRLPCLP